VVFGTLIPKAEATAPSMTGILVEPPRILPVMTVAASKVSAGAAAAAVVVSVVVADAAAAVVVSVVVAGVAAASAVGSAAWTKEPSCGALRSMIESNTKSDMETLSGAGAAAAVVVSVVVAAAPVPGMNWKL